MNEQFEFIDAEERCATSNWSVRKMCAWLGVNRSSYNDWKTRPESATATWRRQMSVLLVKAFEESEGTYGYRRLAAVLARWGYPIDPGVVRRLMGDLGLVAARPKRRGPITTIAGDAAAIPDLVRRNFTATAPGQKWCGDITYIRTWEGWVYLATVLDMFSRKVIGYALADHMRTDLIVTALAMAVRNSPESGPGTVFHSDRGCQYTSEEFARTCRAYGIVQSMGRTGVCWDNAWAESFNGTLKIELCHRKVYPTRAHAIKDVTRYIELRYNQTRLHSTLGYRTPNEVETEWREAQQGA